MKQEKTADEELATDGEAARVEPVLFIEPEPDLVDALADAESDCAGSPATEPTVRQVARFITEPPSRLGGPRDPRVDGERALSTLQLLEAEELALERPPEPRSIPPALPPAVRSEPPPLPNVVLGPPLSMRGEITERLSLVPKTHPMANSLAPGGSALSTAPPARGASLRLSLALGGLALLALGLSTSSFLQSRGEQHAAAAARRGEEAAPQEPRAPARIDPVEAAPAAVLPLDERARADEPPPPRAASPAPGSRASRAPVPRAEGPIARARGARAGLESGASGLRISMGSVALRPRPRGAATPPREDVLAAMQAMHDEVRACAGDAHGIADVQLTVLGSGVISHALVEGSLGAAPAGRCIVARLRGARLLPPFDAPWVRVRYPFRLDGEGAQER